MKSLTFPYFFSFLISCGGSGNSNSVKSIGAKSKDAATPKNKSAADDSATFYTLKNDLYINKRGEISYRSYDQTVPADVRYKFLRHVNNFDTLNGERREIRPVVDTATFESLGDLYYRDKRYSYYHFPMMDGGYFLIIWEADPHTLRVFGKSWYAKDREHIFCRGSILKEADYKTFTVIPLVSQGDTVRWLGKDKNNIYETDRKLDKKRIKDWNLE